LSVADDVSVVLCGEAGQGIQTVEQALTEILTQGGHNVFSTKEYMSRIRGGCNSTQIRVSATAARACLSRIDILVAFTSEAFAHLEGRISGSTLILGEREAVRYHGEMVDIPFGGIAREIGGAIYANTVAIGVLLGLLRADEAMARQSLDRRFASKSPEIVERNARALQVGYEEARKLLDSGGIRIDVAPAAPGGELLMNGAEAVALGAIAGGCDFVSSYPMSPSTGVLTYLAGRSSEFGIVVEQAEDEIAAVNMALGAWYAGARALVTTSGGGFALMTEGMSLAGMIESPLVVHLAQRPGPATGLPTRTEQGDFDLARHAGHGEFPRAIYAPGTLRQMFDLTRRAFDQADRHQVPAIILTDQYLIDSYYNTPAPELSPDAAEKHVVRTEKEYRRFAPAASGVSPRGVPGFGEGLVCVDSSPGSSATPWSRSLWATPTTVFLSSAGAVRTTW
jgi:2-oxoglutarate ferredoxin oxidoreductase subunit alpha